MITDWLHSLWESLTWQRVVGGTLLFVVQGQDPSDPAARRSITDVAQAVERPLEQSQQKLDAVNQQHRRDSRPQRQRSVGRQIREIENAE